MITYTGQSVWPRGSRYGDQGVPSLEDIAVGLGRQSRFCGHAPVFYTVLCHTLVCAQVGPPHLRRALLLHDAAEAIVSDIPSPWKTPQQREVEVELLGRIYYQHHPVPLTDEDRDTIKQIDLDVMVAEARVLELAGLSEEHGEYWLSFPLTEQIEHAMELTQMSAYVGNPIRFIEPRSAIEAFLQSWRSAS